MGFVNLFIFAKYRSISPDTASEGQSSCRGNH